MRKIEIVADEDQAALDAALMAVVGKLVEIKYETGVDHYGDFLAGLNKQARAELAAAEARHGRRMGW